MAEEKRDYIEKCNQSKMPTIKHMELKCASCRKADCVRAAKAK